MILIDYTLFKYAPIKLNFIGKESSKKVTFKIMFTLKFILNIAPYKIWV